MIRNRLKAKRRKRAAAVVDSVRARIKPGFSSAKSIRQDRDA